MESLNTPNAKKPTDPKLTKFIEFLQKNQIVSKNRKTEERPNQISLSLDNMSALDLIREINSIDPEMLDSVKIVESSHSLDILSKNISKLDLLQHLKKTFGCKNTLCIGDRGLWPGNDYELLSTDYSLSADEVNKNPDTCWNIAPIGYKGEQAVVNYLKFMRTQNNNFKLNFSEIKK